MDGDSSDAPPSAGQPRSEPAAIAPAAAAPHATPKAKAGNEAAALQALMDNWE
jgi:hypothetical protein